MAKTKNQKEKATIDLKLRSPISAIDQRIVAALRSRQSAFIYFSILV